MSCLTCPVSLRLLQVNGVPNSVNSQGRNQPNPTAPDTTSSPAPAPQPGILTGDITPVTSPAPSPAADSAAEPGVDGTATSPQLSVSPSPAPVNTFDSSPAPSGPAADSPVPTNTVDSSPAPDSPVPINTVTTSPTPNSNNSAVVEQESPAPTNTADASPTPNIPVVEQDSPAPNSTMDSSPAPINAVDTTDSSPAPTSPIPPVVQQQSPAPSDSDAISPTPVLGAGYTEPYYLALAGSQKAFPDFKQAANQIKVAEALHSALGLASSYKVSNFKVWLASISNLPVRTSRRLLQDSQPDKLLVLGFALAKQAGLPDAKTLVEQLHNRTTAQQVAVELAQKPGLFAPELADSVGVGIVIAANVSEVVQYVQDLTAVSLGGK